MGNGRKVLSTKHKMEQEGWFLFSILERRASKDWEITEGTWKLGVAFRVRRNDNDMDKLNEIVWDTGGNLTIKALDSGTKHPGSAMPEAIALCCLAPHFPLHREA